MIETLYFHGTIADLKEELTLSGVYHLIEQKTDLVMTIRLDNKPKGGFRFEHRDNIRMANGTIKATRQTDSVRLLVELDEDSWKTDCEEVHSRWIALYDYLVNQGLVQFDGYQMPNVSSKPMPKRHQAEPVHSNQQADIVHNEDWWHNGKLSTIKALIHKPPYHFTMAIDYIETSVDLLAEWFLRQSQEFRGIEIEAHPDVKMEIPRMQQLGRGSVVQLHQDLTLCPQNTLWRSYGMRAITYNLEQLAPNRVRLNVNRQQIDRIVILFDTIIRELLRTWHTAKIIHPSHYPDETAIVKDGWPTANTEALTPMNQQEDDKTILPQPDNLTDKEKEVAHCLANGLNKKEIAEHLVMSTGTTKVHFRNIAPKWELDTQSVKILQIEAKRRGYGKGRKG